MDKTQKSKVNMFIAMGLFFTKYAAVFTGFAQLITEITGFGTSNTSLQDEISKQTLKIGGVVTAKNDLLDKAIKLLVKSSRKARAWAVNTGNSALAAQFDVQISTFEHMSQTVVINAMNLINAAISTNVASLNGYKVVAADVTAITAAINAAQASIGTPKQAHTTKVTATKEIVKDINNCDAHLELIDDLLISEYEDTNTAMVDEYRLSRELEPIGTHPTGLHALIKAAITNVLLEGVLVTIMELNKTGLTNIDGITEIEHMKSGKYHVIISKVGFVSQTIIINFPLGKIQTIGILMVAV